MKIYRRTVRVIYRGLFPAKKKRMLSLNSQIIPSSAKVNISGSSTYKEKIELINIYIYVDMDGNLEGK